MVEDFKQHKKTTKLYEKNKYKLVASNREKDCTLKTDLRYPVPELKQLKQTRLRLWRWVFIMSGNLLRQSISDKPAKKSSHFQRSGCGRLEPEISRPITALPHHGGWSVSHTTDLLLSPATSCRQWQSGFARGSGSP